MTEDPPGKNQTGKRDRFSRIFGRLVNWWPVALIAVGLAVILSSLGTTS